MTEHSGQNVTRNMLIEDAIEAYIDEASKMLTQDELWPAPYECSKPFDTVVLPAGEDGFHEVFLESVLKLAECRIGADFFVRQGDWAQES